MAFRVRLPTYMVLLAKCVMVGDVTGMVLPEGAPLIVTVSVSIVRTSPWDQPVAAPTSICEVPAVAVVMSTVTVVPPAIMTGLQAVGTMPESQVLPKDHAVLATDVNVEQSTRVVVETGVVRA